MENLLALWREACRHIELAESAPRLARLVVRRVPADLLLVRHLLRDAPAVETLAVARMGAGTAPRQARTPCEEPEALAAWCAAGDVLSLGREERAGPAAVLVPADLRGAVLALGLHAEGGAAGALVLARRDPFTPAEAEALAAMREPFAVALGNHLRVHELERLREAAEAEKRALLVRLRRRDLVEEIVGADGSLRAVMTRVEQVCATDAPVLLLGETGTGKEVVARAIHARSPRRDGPIVRVNCGAIPTELVDAELFGHERGAFTGAVQTRRGWFERAHGGTLFLDEVGELPAAAQVRLLRVLQDGSYERVGGDEMRTADVRVIAATHRNLETLVREGRFREDLWYRMSVFPIHLPPLRARREDMPALADHFARNAGLRLGGAPLAVSEADLRLLEAYAWPGNVRELAAVIERAAILGSGLRLDLAGALETRLYAQEERLRDAAPRGDVAAAPRPAAPAPFADAVRVHLEDALRQAGGRVEGPRGAAAVLGLNPSTLRAKLRKHGLAPSAYRQG
jgi:hydrogenase-4 transcriptional activator